MLKNVGTKRKNVMSDVDLSLRKDLSNERILWNAYSCWLLVATPILQSESYS